MIDCFSGSLADLVVCDGAPDLTGMHDLDEFGQQQLMVAALSIVVAVLRPGGHFVSKVFRGADIHILMAQMRTLFPLVELYKPSSSRANSLEHFMVCRGYAPPPTFHPRHLMSLLNGNQGLRSGDLETPEMTTMVPFIYCGDLDGLHRRSAMEGTVPG